MFEILNRYPNIRVNLEPGLYRFNPVSGSGKTWLTSVLQSFNMYGEAVNGYTLLDFHRGVDLKSILNDSAVKLVVIDRYDMLPAELSIIIDSVEDKIVILACIHDYHGKKRVHSCNIILEENRITIVK